MNIPIDAQVKCVTRELGFRERVYRRKVSEGKMTQAEATYELEAMRAVLATLQGIAAGERLI